MDRKSDTSMLPLRPLHLRQLVTALSLQRDPKKLVVLSTPTLIPLSSYCHGYLPGELSSHTSGHDMVNGQVFGMEGVFAILTGVLVPQENISSGKGGFVTTLWHVFIQCHNRGQWDFNIGRSNRHAFVDIHYCYFATKDQFDSFLPVTNTQWQIRHWLENGITRRSEGPRCKC